MMPLPLFAFSYLFRCGLQPQGISLAAAFLSFCTGEPERSSVVLEKWGYLHFNVYLLPGIFHFLCYLRLSFSRGGCF
jgi:hypothetical protein